MISRIGATLTFLALTSIAVVGAQSEARPAGAPSAEQIEFFETEIRPLLANNCFECHSARVETPFGGLRLDSPRGATGRRRFRAGHRPGRSAQQSTRAARPGTTRADATDRGARCDGDREPDRVGRDGGPVAGGLSGGGGRLARSNRAVRSRKASAHALGVAAGPAGRSTGGARRHLASGRGRSVHPRLARSGRARASVPRRSAHAHPSAVVRPAWVAADPRRDCAVRLPTRRRPPTPTSWTGISTRRTSASAGRVTGWTCSVTASHTAARETRASRSPGGIATT